MTKPSRGEIWIADLNPVRGREQQGRRPVLVVSVNQFNHGPSGLIIAVPLTSRDKQQPLHVKLAPPEGGVQVESWIKCEDVRSISVERLETRWGMVSEASLEAVAVRLRRLLGH